MFFELGRIIYVLFIKACVADSIYCDVLDKIKADKQPKIQKGPRCPAGPPPQWRIKQEQMETKKNSMREEPLTPIDTDEEPQGQEDNGREKSQGKKVGQEKGQGKGEHKRKHEQEETMFELKLKTLKHMDLKDECIRKDLPKSGTKAVLTQRLMYEWHVQRRLQDIKEEQGSCKQACERE